jgi:protein ImuB
MFAAIFIPDFPVEAIVRLRPELRERAVAVLEGTAPLLRVSAVNERAADAGLEPGMTKLQAEEIAAASNAVLAMRSVEQEASAQAALLDVAWGFSPRVENTAPGLVVLDIAGLERIFGPPAKMARDMARRCSEIGLESQVAVAANPDATMHAARGFSGVTVIAEGREAERLATLPVEVLAAGESPQRTPGTQMDLFHENSASSAPKFHGKATPNPADLLNTLESWGVRNLRGLAALPEVAVAERLGQGGLHWQRMARGATRRALHVAEAAVRFEETCELEHPLESLEPLSFVLNRMLEQLCARLAARALATNEIGTTLTLDRVEDRVIGSSGHRVNEEPVENGAASHDDKSPDHQIARSSDLMTRCLRLPVPMLDAKIFLKLLQLDLQAHPPGAPVVKVAMEALAAEPRRAQNGLFEAGAPEPERLEVTLARIDGVVRDQNIGPSGDRVIESRGKPDEGPMTRSPDVPITSRVGFAEVLDTHRPDALRMKPFAAAQGTAIQKSEIKTQQSTTALRLFRPPLAARVSVRAGKPARMESETVSGEISWAAGPWKVSGDWWTEQPWAREEWDVCVGEACYRMYRDARGWFVEGTYD